jgi:uncharacterized membrane protein YdbT with pleckstrin-like domain
MVWAAAQLFGLIVIVLSSIMAATGSTAAPSHLAMTIITGIGAITWAVWLLQLLVTYAILRLDYEHRWYILTDRSLRIREGVLRVNEKTMAFANIQHLSVRQGPLQRLLGVADLEVRTAGGGGGSVGAHHGQASATSNTHIAYFRGVDNAEEIRAAIGDRIRLYRDAGLGDPDDVLPVPASSGGETAGASFREGAAHPLLAAARELGGEARALREVLDRADP